MGARLPTAQICGVLVAIAHHLDAAYHLVRTVGVAHGIGVREFTSLREAEVWLTQVRAL